MKKKPKVPRVSSEGNSSSATAAVAAAPSSWILGIWWDLILFVATPALIVPAIALLQSPRFNLDVSTLSLLVAGFGAMGHHLPGMIRAYGDVELFRRFRWRFVIAPLFLLAVCIPLARNHLGGMMVILLFWGYWHGLMQVYGFVRIYDVKVGSTSNTTAMWDWLMCLCWFATGVVFSDGRMATLLETLYTSGGPVIPAAGIQAFRWICAGITGMVTMGFLVHFARQWKTAQRPNPIKLLMLASGIGFWWFCMVFVQEVLLGIAMFEIFHDVQYLAIVWLYNRRRVDRAAEMGVGMRYLFRGSVTMGMLYVALVCAYGSMRILSDSIETGTLRLTLTGFIWASTILHFYYDGFIWKVRDQTLREGLGVSSSSGVGAGSFVVGELAHVLKWSPFVIVVCWLSVSEWASSAPPPPGMGQRLWANDRYVQWNENITAAIPSYLMGHVKLASMLDNVGRTEEALTRLRTALEQDSQFAPAHLTLARIHRRLEKTDEAIGDYERTVQFSHRVPELIEAHLALGQIYQQRGDKVKAADAYQQVLAIEPNFEPALDGLRAVTSK